MYKIIVAAVLFAAAMWVNALTFLTECDDWYMRQTSQGLEMRCRSSALTVPPWLTIAGCLKATAQRDQSTGKIIIRCGAGSFAGPPVAIK